MSPSGRTRVFGLIGHPVRHSLSPGLYNRLFAEFGIDAVYIACDVHPSRAAGVADAIRCLDFQGINLTVPFKAAIIPHLDSLTRAAEEARAVNVVIQHDGYLTGYNTDGEGFATSLEEATGPLPADASVVVLGAGGAARAVAGGLAARGAARITLLNRTPDAAIESASHLGRFFPQARFTGGPLTAEDFSAAAGAADLVVNATAGGADGLVRGLNVGCLRPEALVADLNYWMPDPPLLAAAAARGLKTLDGLPMLAHQGALAFELFTGQPVSGSELLTALRQPPR